MNYYAKSIIRSGFQKTDGTTPVYLRLTFDRKVKRIALNLSIHKIHWDKKGFIKDSHPEADQLNLLIKGHLKRANDIIYSYEIQSKSLTFDEFDMEFRKQKSDSYFDFVQHVLDNNSVTNEYSAETLYSHKTELSKLKKFRKTLLLKEITPTFLQAYEGYMRNTLSNGVNTIHKSLKTIRSYVNRAIMVGKLTENPFNRYKLKTEAGKREYLTMEELAKMEALLDEPILKYIGNALRVFLFCCYTGLRYGDVKALKYEDIENGLILIKMHKTKELVSIPVISKAKALIPPFDGKDLVFNVPKNQVINRFLKEAAKKVGLKKNISFHSARHTFATTSLTLGMKMEVVSKVLGHKDMKTTQIYAKVVDNLKIEEMSKWDAYYAKQAQAPPKD